MEEESAIDELIAQLLEKKKTLGKAKAQKEIVTESSTLADKKKMHKKEFPPLREAMEVDSKRKEEKEEMDQKMKDMVSDSGSRGSYAEILVSQGSKGMNQTVREIHVTGNCSYQPIKSSAQEQPCRGYPNHHRGIKNYQPRGGKHHFQSEHLRGGKTENFKKDQPLINQGGGWIINEPFTTTRIREESTIENYSERGGNRGGEKRKDMESGWVEVKRKRSPPRGGSSTHFFNSDGGDV